MTEEGRAEKTLSEDRGGKEGGRATDETMLKTQMMLG